MKRFPALDAMGIESGLLLAELDDCSPSAAEERGVATRVFFNTPALRDAALRHLRSRGIAASSLDVPDEDWAQRSQQGLTPVFVGNICILPPWHVDQITKSPNPQIVKFVVVIQPSMGFGTGHHATTRLCLRALQELPLEGKDVVDVGTGSGVLAIAASLLGARSALGLDNDSDALRNARENLALNPRASSVRFAEADIAIDLASGGADVLVANLTGALLAREAHRLMAAVRSGGTIILCGLMTPERPAVQSAFADLQLLHAFDEDDWTALVFAKR